ncbi:MAG TPA: T9SS type A sorting domain-containing protein [Candidatus Eisenbacteria bacterium]
MRLASRRLSIVLLFAALSIPALARAAASYWSHDWLAPSRVHNFTFVGTVPDAAVPDGAGGAFIFWEDLRNGSRDVFGAHVLADGSLDPSWPFGGLGVCTAAGDQTSIRALPDGAGGVFVCWSDARSGVAKPYVTDLLANGTPAPGYGANGVGVETSLPNADGPPQMCIDLSGGIQLAWEYTAGAGNQDIYGAQVVGGAVVWMKGLITTPVSQTGPVIVSDGGTTNMAWVEAGQIWLGRYFYNTGAMLGSPVSPSSAPFTNGSPRIAAASSQIPYGSVVVWLATNAGETAPMAAYYFAGVVWNNLGVVSSPASTVFLGDLVYSGASSDWFVFAAGGAPPGLYVQQITPYNAGSAVLLTSKTDWTYPAHICPDGLGGVVAAYSDVMGPESVKALRVMADNTLAPLWGAPANGGTLVIQDPWGMGAGGIASDGRSGAIVVGREAVANPAIVYNRVDRWGALDGAPVIVSVRDVLNDQGGQVRVTWNASYLDVPYPDPISGYWIWRQVPAAAAQARIRGGAPQYRADAAAEPAPGTLRLEPAQAQGFAWEFVASQAADGFSQYSYVASTMGDSVAGSNPRTTFMIEARSSAYTLGWPSTPDSGYSVDNLPPPAPAPFTGTYSAGTALLSWGAVGVSDLAGYRLYRGTSASFVPGPSNLVAALNQTSYTDQAGAPYYYRLTAVDVHGNESPSTLLLPTGTLAVDGTAPPTLALAPPAPNPARGSTLLAFTLPHEMVAHLALFDVNGRRVRTLVEGMTPAGEHVSSWDLRDDAGREVGAGLYLARFEAEGHVLTRRVMALR